MNAKPWHQSKTIIVNVVAALLVAVQALTGALQPLLPVDLYQAIAAALPVVNGILRLLTDTAVTLDT